jgi:F-type H+-transporting ATPase subunit a
MAKKRGCLGCSIPVLLAVGVPLAALVLLSLVNLFAPDVLPTWLRAANQPEVHLPAAVIFNVLGFPITNTLLTTWITILLLVGLSFVVARRMKFVPGRLQSVFEMLLGFVYNLCRDVAGEKNGRMFFPVVATIFLFVGFNAWLGLLPGYGAITVLTAHGETHLLRPANTDLNTPLAIALMSLIFVQAFGFKALGLKYLGRFVAVGRVFKSFGQIFKGKVGEGFVGLITGVIEAFLGFLELLSEFVIHTISFTFRLFGNMTAGETLIVVMLFLLPFVIPTIFYGLEILIGFIQAIIFSGLTLIFLTMAAAHGEEEHGH